jgi:hypothetical protein
LKSSLREFYDRNHDLVDRYGIYVHQWQRICSACRKYFPVYSSSITYHRICNYINTTGASSEAGTAYPSGEPEFTPGFNCGSSYLIFMTCLCVCFVYRCLSFCTFSFGHSVICYSSICGFWLPLWDLQTLISSKKNWYRCGIL